MNWLLGKSCQMKNLNRQINDDIYNKIFSTMQSSQTKQTDKITRESVYSLTHTSSSLPVSFLHWFIDPIVTKA